MLPIYLMLNSSQSPSVAQETVDGNSLDISVVSMNEVETLFKKYSSMDLNWNIPEYGCQARAALFAYDVDRHNSIKVGKAMMTTQNSMYDYFLSPTKENSRVCFKWSFHVAPMVRVFTGNKIENIVLDPTLFKRPVTLNDWQKVARPEKPNNSLKVRIYSRFKSVPMREDIEKDSWKSVDLSGAQNFLSTQKNASLSLNQSKTSRVKCKIN
jgi:hypothetical protein